LIEVDVTEARDRIRTYEFDHGEKLSFTAFVIYCLSRAIEDHPHLHAYRDWRNRLVIYEDVHITSMFEVDADGRRIPTVHVFQSTNRKSFLQIHRELRDFQGQSHATREFRFNRWFLRMPGFIRRAFYWVVLRVPQSFRDHSSPVMVTAVGMFGEGGGWAITMPNFTLNIALGGISQKPWVHRGEIIVREVLDMTVSIDHDIVDGAPAARFVHSLRTLMEEAFGLGELQAPSS
jgi:pyruvate/2-oxoglutarate dehydrogenase complex dihydrolipoamide acyltransferase (E2) component